MQTFLFVLLFFLPLSYKGKAKKSTVLRAKIFWGVKIGRFDLAFSRISCRVFRHDKTAQATTTAYYSPQNTKSLHYSPKKQTLYNALPKHTQTTQSLHNNQKANSTPIKPTTSHNIQKQIQQPQTQTQTHTNILTYISPTLNQTPSITTTNTYSTTTHMHTNHKNKHKRQHNNTHTHT